MVVHPKKSSAWKDAEKFQKIFSKSGPENFPIYTLNSGKSKLMRMIPDPPSAPLSEQIAYDASDEPCFDPKVHVELVAPANISIFDETSVDEFKTQPFGEYVCIPNHKGSQFAYSDPFQFLSVEGCRVAREILTAMKKCAKDNGRSTCVRFGFQFDGSFESTFDSVRQFPSRTARGHVRRIELDLLNVASF